MSGVASPELTKVIIIAGGLLIALTAWNTLHKHMDNWAGSPVYGEHQQQVVAPEREELKSLPIVVANEAQHIDLNSDLDSSEAAIQKAFMVPVVEEVVEEEPKVSLVQQLLALHKPSIAAIGGGGVIINGHFWAINSKFKPCRCVTAPVWSSTQSLPVCVMAYCSRLAMKKSTCLTGCKP